MIGDRPDEPVTQFLVRASQHLNKAYCATSYMPHRERISLLRRDLNDLIAYLRQRHTELTTTRSLFPPAPRPRTPK